MTGLVLDLQRDALDSAVPVGALLRKASVIARKLGLRDVDDWVALELGGYGDREPPEYRTIKGEVKARNPFHGWIPLIMEDPKIADIISQRRIGQSIFELEDLLRGDHDNLHVTFGPQQQSLIMSMMEVKLQPALHVTRQSVLRIVQTVRDRVLNLALDWEERGILGDGLTFTREEKVTASSINYTTINNIGEMNHSQLQQHSSGAQTLNASNSKELLAFADAVAKSLAALQLERDERAELEAEIATLRSQAASPKPKAGIVRSTLLSMKTIIEGAAGNVAAAALLPQLAPLLGIATGG